MQQTTKCVENIQVIDVGARYGLFPTFTPLVSRSKIVLVEPDPDEAARLKNSYKLHDSVSVVAAAIGTSGGDKKLLVRRHRGLSGLIEHRTEVGNLFPSSDLETEQVLNVPSIRLESLIGFSPVLLKIDCEGTELDVLKSAGNRLDYIVGIQAEVGFRSLFVDGTQFSEFDQFLSQNNFDFLGLSSPAREMGKFPLPASRGRPIAGDGLWIRKSSQFKSDDQLIAAAIFQYLHGYDGLALQSVSMTSESTRRKMASGELSALHHYLYGLVLKHLSSARRVPHFDVAEVNNLHLIMFQSEIPDRARIFELLNSLGVTII